MRLQPQIEYLAHPWSKGCWQDNVFVRQYEHAFLQARALHAPKAHANRIASLALSETYWSIADEADIVHSLSALMVHSPLVGAP